MFGSTESTATVGIWAAAIGLLGLLFRQIGPWRKQISEAEERLRTELREQLTEERAAHAVEVRSYIREREEMGDRIAKLEQDMSRQQRRHEAERALDRLNNITACFDALLLLVETNPEKAPEIVKKIKEMRGIQLKAEAEEKAIIRAAEIKADNEEVA